MCFRSMCMATIRGRELIENMCTLDKNVKKQVFLRSRNHEMAAILFQKLNSECYSRIVELQLGRLFLYKTLFF